MLNQELGEPFRRDAMKKPVVVAGVDRADMRAQTIAKLADEDASALHVGAQRFERRAARGELPRRRGP